MRTRLRLAALVVALGSLALVLIGPAIGGQAQVGPAQQQQHDNKRDRAALDAQAIAAAQTTPRPPKNATKPVRPAAAQAEAAQLPRRDVGGGTIVESGLAPLPGAVYTIENRWFERRAGGELVVYAGAQRQDPAQGVVVVRPSRAELGGPGVFLTPTKAGSVRVVGASGERVQLQAANGTPFAFEVPARRFVSP